MDGEVTLIEGQNDTGSREGSQRLTIDDKFRAQHSGKWLRMIVRDKDLRVARVFVALILLAALANAIIWEHSQILPTLGNCMLMVFLIARWRTYLTRQ